MWAVNVLLVFLWIYSSSDYSVLEIESSYASYYTTGETLDYSYGALGTTALTMEISYSKAPNDITGYYDKNYDVKWSNVLESIFGSYKMLMGEKFKKES